LSAGTDGTGNFYFEDYFIFDKQQNLPVNLAVGRAAAAELSKVLPPGGLYGRVAASIFPPSITPLACG
jgi:hypothetical protein